MIKIFFICICSLISLYSNWDIVLDEKNQELAKNHYAYKTYISDKISTSYAILDVDKNINQVWQEINDFSNYTDNIDSIDKANIYEKTQHTVKVMFLFSKFFISKKSYFTHNIDKKHYKITWILDENKPYGFFSYSSGAWVLKKINSNKTRVFYKNSISLPNWVPNIIKRYLINTASKDAIIWLL